jgi:hypothetical protein
VWSTATWRWGAHGECGQARRWREERVAVVVRAWADLRPRRRGAQLATGEQVPRDRRAGGRAGCYFEEVMNAEVELAAAGVRPATQEDAH